MCLLYKITNPQHPNLSALTHLPSLWYEQRLKMFFLKLVPFCKFSAFNFFFRFRLRLLSIQVAPIVHFINKTLSTLKSHYSHNNPKCSDRTFFPPSHNTRDFPQCTWTVFWKDKCRNTVSPEKRCWNSLSDSYLYQLCRNLGRGNSRSTGRPSLFLSGNCEAGINNKILPHIGQFETAQWIFRGIPLEWLRRLGRGLRALSRACSSTEWRRGTLRWVREQV